MSLGWIILYLFFVTTRVNCQSVSLIGSVSMETTFYYEEFPTSSSRLAVLDYWLSFPVQTEEDYFNVFLHTTQNHPNLDNRCSVRAFGQVRNVDLHVTCDSDYRACSRIGSKLICNSSITVQDYKPRHFGVSFGFFCHDLSRKSLKGLKYNVTLHSQSNTSTCVPTPDTVLNCSRSYSHTSLPNLLDNYSVEDARGAIRDVFRALLLVQNLVGQDQVHCYPHIYKLTCYLFFPQCIASTNDLVVPCRETYEEFRQECFDGISGATDIPVNLLSGIVANFDNEYLPSKFGDIPCYYEEVTCGPPPNVSRAQVTMATEFDNKTFVGGSIVEYSCINGDSWEISGTVITGEPLIIQSE